MTLEALDLRTIAAEWFLQRLTNAQAKNKLGAAMADAGDVATIFRDLNVMPVDADEAREWLLVGWCRGIIVGDINPSDGARWISHVFAGTDWAEEVSPMIALASEWESDADHRALYEGDIRQAAAAILAARQQPETRNG